MAQFAICYTTIDGYQGILRVHAEDIADAREYWYTSEIDGKIEFIAEILELG